MAQRYTPLGIAKYRGAYILDRDRTRRAAALQTLVAGLAAEGLADGKYGTNFWQPIATRYDELAQQLTAANSTIAQAVSQKDTLRAEIETVLSSLTKVLDGNYPDKQEYKAKLRA